MTLKSRCTTSCWLRIYMLVLVALGQAKLIWEVELTLFGQINENTFFSLSSNDNFVERFKTFSSKTELPPSSQRALLLHAVMGMIDMYRIPVVFDYAISADNFMQSQMFNEYDDISAIQVLSNILDRMQHYISDYLVPVNISGDYSTITYPLMTSQRLLYITGPQFTIVRHAEHQRADVLFLLRNFISFNAHILDVGAHLGLMSLQLSELIPKGHLVACTSQGQSKLDHEHLSTNMKNFPSHDIIDVKFLEKLIFGGSYGSQTGWDLVRINYARLDAEERSRITEEPFLSSLIGCEPISSNSSPIILVTLFGDAVSLQESLVALQTFRHTLVTKCRYELFALPYHGNADFIAIPTHMSTAYRNTYERFIFDKGHRRASYGVEYAVGGGETEQQVFPGDFFSKEPIVVWGVSGSSSDILETATTSGAAKESYPYICTSYLDCGEDFRNRLAQYDKAPLVLMFTTSLSERGTSWQLYQYAHYAEELLGMKGRLYFIYPLDSSDFSQDMGNLFKARFGVDHIFEIPTTDLLSVNIDALVDRGITHIYNIAHGLINECPKKRPDFAKILYHCVFYATTPCGDAYARISSSVATADSDTSHNTVPVVPHIVEWDASLANGDSMRGELGIPADAVVFCRHGGKDSFDISFVRDMVIDVARHHPNDKYFIFMNTELFTAEPLKNIIHIPGSINEQTKLRFIRTCDAMLHARDNGETFGLAIAEFSVLNRPVITSTAHTDNGDARNHIDLLQERGIYYSNSETLREILINFDGSKYVNTDKLRWNSYGQFRPRNAMRRFEEVFLNSVTATAPAIGHQNTHSNV
jgi:hypothetical protein